MYGWINIARTIFKKPDPHRFLTGTADVIEQIINRGNILLGTYLNACGLYIGGKQYGKYEYKYEDLTPADYQ